MAFKGMDCGYFTWWTQQMRHWIPERLYRRHTSPVLIVQADPGLASFSLMLRSVDLGEFRVDSADTNALRAAVPARPSATILRLPSGLLLECEIVLPLVAERAPEQLLEYEMDRNTPFAASEVFWSCAVERRDRARDRLHLRLTLVAKTALDPLMPALAAAGVIPTALESMSGTGVPLVIDMHHDHSSGIVNRSVGAAAILITGLAIAAAALPFVMQSIASRHVDAQIAQLQPIVAEAEGLRRRIAGAAASVDIITAERIRDGNTLDLLAAVTDVLPDNAYLSELSLHQGNLTLTGQSTSAARLIAALSADPTFRHPAFAGPVIRIDKDHADQFVIRLEIAQ